MMVKQILETRKVNDYICICIYEWFIKRHNLKKNNSKRKKFTIKN